MSKKGGRAEQKYAKQPFLLSKEEIFSHLETRGDWGLRSTQVQEYQQKYGPNKLEGDGGVSWYAILGKQISNAMILVCLMNLRMEKVGLLTC
jgi:magnesium-transporting ATPase (P-type)